MRTLHSTFRNFHLLKRICKATSLMAFCVASGYSNPHTQVGDPKAMLVQTVEEILDILHEDAYRELSVDEKNDQLLGLVESRFSLNVLIQRSLGRNWRKFNQAQQTEFKQLFGKLIIYTYSKRLEESDQRPKFEFGKTVELPKDRMEIQSEVEYLNDKISVYYRLAKRNDQWEVYDIVVEGISLLTNYRKQFNSIMRRGSPEELLAALREKVGAL